MIDFSNTSDSFKAGMAAVQRICATKTPAEREIISKFCGEALQFFVATELLPADMPDMIACQQVTEMLAANKTTSGSEN